MKVRNLLTSAILAALVTAACSSEAPADEHADHDEHAIVTTTTIREKPVRSIAWHEANELKLNERNRARQDRYDR